MNAIKRWGSMMMGLIITLIGASRALAVDATGGAITTAGGARIHSFTNVGTTTFTVTAPGYVELLVVAGGGGGGCFAGGGGAGGLIYSNAVFLTNGSYTVAVGDGGQGDTDAGGTGKNGTNSVFGALTAYGGGGGGSRYGAAPFNGTDGAGGGSGGGGSPADAVPQGLFGAATNGQGNAGGNGAAFGWGGGGGAGAGAVGGPAVLAGTRTPANTLWDTGGNGGAGLSYSISGSAVSYAGGGGGGTYKPGSGGSGSAGSGGVGGGGNGGKGANGADGVANSGGGGGGSDLAPYKGGKGGSGVVIVRYALPDGKPTVYNDAGATGVTDNAAWLTGTLVSTGTSETVWGMVWGTNNAASLTAWQYATNFGVAGSDNVATSLYVEGLSKSQTYYFKLWATNASGTNLTSAVSFEAVTHQTGPFQMPINFTGYTGRSETLTNFPVLVVFSNGIGGTDFNFKRHPFLSANGWDLRFTDATESDTLDYEIEQWSAKGPCYVWVRVPTIPADGSGRIWAKWGDATMTDQLPCTTNGAVWANGYVGVWHLPNGTTLSTRDSSTNRVHGTLAIATATSGVVGGAGAFSGSGQFIATGLNNVNHASGTVSWWMLPTTAYNSGAIRAFWGQISGTSEFDAQIFSNNKWYVGWQTGPDHRVVIDATAANYPTSLWSFYTFTWGSGGSVLYRNGSPIGSNVTAPTTVNLNSAICIARQSINSTTYFPGGIDEMRISRTLRSPDWIWASWMNQGSNVLFQTYDDPSEVGGDVGPGINNEAPTQISTTAASFNGYLWSAGSESTTVKLFWGDSDGGIPGMSWQHTEEWAPDAWSEGSHPAKTITFPIANRMYFYTYYASNAVDDCWPAPAVVQKLLAGEVTITATANGSEEGPVNGAFTISRPVDATNGALTVNYTVDATVANTAENGVDYTELLGSVELAAGTSSVTVEIEVLPDILPQETDETVRLCLTPGLYTIGSSSNAQITITNQLFTSLFNPRDFPAINGGAALHPSVTVTCFTGTAASPAPTITIDGGSAISGRVVTNSNEGVAMALFCFSSINIPSGATISVTGDRGLVLASRDTFDFGATLSVAGTAGTGYNGTKGYGGPGAEGGVHGISFSSLPPGGTAGDGGQGSGNWGNGFGGGGPGEFLSYKSGSGGGYGGAGGLGARCGNAVGSVYGDESLGILYGGSGGGGSYRLADIPGGGGGGTVEFIALGTLTLSGSVNASGGAGSMDSNLERGAGGGSGGGILLAAPSINLSGMAVGAIDAKGGAGGDYGGGGGGGGRVAIYAQTITGLAADGADADPYSDTINVAGGPRGSNPSVVAGYGTAGSLGTFRYKGDGGSGNLSFPYLPNGTVLMLR